MSQTSLYNEHKALGAKLVDFAGWEMPIQYKNLKEEVIAVRKSVGVFDVSHMGEFFVTGVETIKFVDHLVTNDIVNAPMLKAIYSPLCREDGTVIDDLIVYKISENNLMICVNAGNIQKDYEWIATQAKNFDVEVKDKSADYSLLAVQGPETYSILSQMDLQAKLNDIEYYSLQIIDENSETPIIFARTGYTGEDGFEIFGPHEYIVKIWKQLMEKEVTPCGLGARDVLRLEVGYPLYGHELNDEVTPLDSGLRWTVKQSKESFIGKKFLSEYTPKYRLAKFILDKGIPREGYAVKNSHDEVVGVVTSGTMSVGLGKGVAITRIEKEKFTEDDSYYIEIRNKNYPAIFTKKAFINGGHK